MFHSKDFIVSGLIVMTLIHFVFCVWCKIGQTKANMTWYHLFVESKKKKNQAHKNRVGSGETGRG